MHGCLLSKFFSVCVCICAWNTSLAHIVLKVNVYTDNGDDVLESILTSARELLLHYIKQLIIMEQVP